MIETGILSVSNKYHKLFPRKRMKSEYLNDAPETLLIPKFVSMGLKIKKKIIPEFICLIRT